MSNQVDVADCLDAIRTFPEGSPARVRDVEEIGQWCEDWWSQHRDTAVAEAQEVLRTYEAEGPVPDLLRGLGLRDDERFLTRVLAWLLTPRGSHGLGDAFLASFIEECGFDGLERPPEWDGWEVERERKFSWSGSTKADAPDLLIRGPGVIIIIEHKVKAGQTSPDQYVRYRNLARNRWPDLKTFTVFLRSNPLWDDDPQPGTVFDAVLRQEALCAALVAARAVGPRRAALLVTGLLRGLERRSDQPHDSARLLRDGLRREVSTPILLALTQAVLACMEEDS